MGLIKIHSKPGSAYYVSKFRSWFNSLISVFEEGKVRFLDSIVIIEIPKESKALEFQLVPRTS